MRIIISILFLISGFCDLCAQENAIPDYTCEKKLLGYAKLCRTLEVNSTVEDEESPYTYEYEEELARLAKADYSKDSEELYIKKINAYVTKCMSCMICNTLRTRKEQISLLKVAVATGNLDFLRRAIQVYHYPLDLADDIDGMNIMDYVYEEKEYWTKKFPGSKEEELMWNMYKTVKNAGAKFHKYQSLN